MYRKDKKNKNLKNKKSLWKRIIKKEEKIVKSSWFEWLINYVPNRIKNYGWF